MAGIITDENAVTLIQDARLFNPANPQWMLDAVSRIQSQGGDAQLEEYPALASWLQQAQARAAAGKPPVEFGPAAREQLFLLGPGWAYLNHGSYGATLCLLAEAQAWWQRRQEEQPVRFMETEALAGMRHAQRALASFVNADPRDLVFLPNATAAANCVLQSAGLGPGDLVLICDLSYAAVRSAAARAAGHAGAGLVEVSIADVLPDGDRILARYEAGLRAGGGRVKLVIIDHIISPLPVHLPVAALSALCRAHSARTLVDGAHAVGAVSLDLPALGATYYTSNLHKWMCTPKGAAFLWVEPAAQAAMRPLVTSHGCGLGFQGEFAWAGTRDYTVLLTLPAAVAMMRALGLERAARYRHDLLIQAAQLLGKAWGTQKVLGLENPEACMAAVELPPLQASSCTLVGSHPSGAGADAEVLAPSGPVAAALHALLRESYKIEVPVLSMLGTLWCRISAQIYNCLEEYQRLADAVLEVQQRGLSVPAAAS